MENLEIVVADGAHFRPSVSLNAETGICEIAGESYLEEASSFYKPVNGWLKEYTSTGKPIVFNFNLSYVNTSSSKHILSILRLLKAYKDSGARVETNWYVEVGDTDTEEDIEDYSIISGIKINIMMKK